MADSVETRTTLSGKSLYLTLTAIVLALDQFTKYWAARVLRDSDDFEVIPGFLNISYTENPGIAFGMLSTSNVRWLLIVVSSVAIVVVVYYLARTPRANRLLLFALSLLVGGISGNLIDRIRMGRVIDFIDVYYQSFHWPVFNVADTAITIGAALMAVELFTTPGPEKTTSKTAAESRLVEEEEPAKQ